MTHFFPKTAVTREIVIFPKDKLGPEQLLVLARRGAFTVIYLAADLGKYTSLRDNLPRNWDMPVPSVALNAAAHRLRDTFVNLDAKSWPIDADRSPWDASLLGERGPFASTIILNLCRLVVFIEAVSGNGRFLVVAEDRAFGLLLVLAAKQAGAVANWLAYGSQFSLRDRLDSILDQAFDWAVVARRRLSVSIRFLGRKIRLLIVRRHRPLRTGALLEADALVVVWGRGRNFEAERPIVHEYNFGRLPALLRDAGINVAYLVHPLTYVAPYRDILANATEARDTAVLAEDLIPWWAIFPALFHGLNFPKQVRGFSVFGIDVTEVLRLEAVRDRRLAVCVEASLFRHIGRRLAQMSIRPNMLWFPYEGQPWEKLLAYGFRESLPETRLVGVQHILFSREYVSPFPSAMTVTSRAFPDLLLTAGEGYSKWFNRDGLLRDRIAEVGAVRYEKPDYVAPRTGQSILCCTGIELDEAIELATKASEGTQGLGIPLIVNLHPVTDEVFRESLRRAVSGPARMLPAHVTFSSASVRELMPQVSTVLYTTSASCFDAVQHGRRAIYVGRDLALDYDKMPDAVAERCRTAAELRALLSSPSSAGPVDPSDLEKWLGPVVDAETLRSYLPTARLQRHQPSVSLR